MPGRKQQRQTLCGFCARAILEKSHERLSTWTGTTVPPLNASNSSRVNQSSSVYKAKFASWVVSPSVTSITHGGTTACTQSIPAAKRVPMPFQTRPEVFGVQTATGRGLHCFGGTLPASKLQCPAHFFLSSVRDRANPLTSKT